MLYASSAFFLGLMLSIFIALSGPIVEKFLIPSMTRSHISGTAAFSSMLSSPMTKSTCAPREKLLPIPILILAHCVV